MSEPFDPYRDWLGVEGGRAAADHYRLLGVKRFETNRQTILAAAQAAITRVERSATNERAAARREVLKAIRAAARCLLDPDARLKYDATLQNNGPAPGHAGPPPASAMPVAVPLPTATPVRRPNRESSLEASAAEQAALSSALWDDEQSIPHTLENTRGGSSWQTSAAVLLGFLVAALLLATGGYVVWRQRQQAEPVAAAEPAPQPVAQAEVPTPVDSEPELPANSDQTASDTAAAGEEEETIVPEPRESPAPRAEAPVEAAPTAAAEPDTINETHAPPSPEFARMLNRVRAALVAREPELARRRLVEANKLAASPAQETTVRRLDALAVQLERFLNALRSGLSKYLPAEELKVNGEIMSIIAVSPEGISLRVEGARRDYTPATLPAPLALLIARAAADEKAPTAKVFFGAFLLVTPRGSRATVRQLWTDAATAGESVDDLLPLLDSGELAIQREPVPDAVARAEADKHVAREFAVTIRGARSKEQREYLIDQLTVAAARANTSADQFAFLSEACAQAAKTPDPRRALAIIDEMARWFRLDPLVLKAQTLAKAATASREADVAREVATSALALLDKAGDEHDVARTLAQAAATAARRSGDEELIKQTTVRHRQVDRAARQREKAASGS